MIRDRGNIKWTAMMLPEHVAKLRDWMDKDHYVEHPELDEWDLQAISYEIEVAHRRQCVTDIKFCEKGEVKFYSGVITEINTRTMCISIDSPFGRDNMPMADIVGVQIAE